MNAFVILILKGEFSLHDPFSFYCPVNVDTIAGREQFHDGMGLADR